MLTALRSKWIARLLGWSHRLYGLSEVAALKRQEFRLLVFFHGYSLAHTIRPLVIARSLRERGYRVEFAGVGPHRDRIAAEGFLVHEVETMPQSRMDEYVARGNYAYYDLEWIDCCVKAEQALIRTIRPDLVMADMRPTLRLTADLEGIDLALIEAGYNQPGYPFPIPLPASFSTSPGPFDDYLKQQTAATLPHSTLYLVADVPELHPPGPHTPSCYHYIGPLIETDLPEPVVIPELAEEAWNTAWPLVYLNCGSTGVSPEFLGPMLEGLSRMPYRVLVTTAGRWTGTPPSPNIRVVDFLPATWIMRRAALFIGIGGIGSIYHALREGVPIIGAPEHLDQEYHLNRVRDLGLGLKLNWEEFHRTGSLLKAVESLFAQYPEFKQRCEVFSGYVRKWQGGTAAADAIDQYFVFRQSACQITPEHLISEAEFIHQLDLSTPDDLGPELLQKLVHQDLHRGLPHVRRGPLLHFDQRDSWNWLYDHEPRFFESDYRALEQKRQQFFILQEDHLLPRRPEQRYRLTYTYRLYPQSLPPDQPAWLFLPYPIVTEYQQDIRLNSCHPEDLQDYLLPTVGFVYAYPLQVDSSSPLEFTYTCELTARARSLRPAPSPQELSPREHKRYIDIDSALDSSALVRALCQQLELDPGLSAWEKAGRLYFHLAQSKRFKKTKEACQCPGCSTQLVFAETGGHCITLSRAFIALCRLIGIPAREVSGALAGYPAGEGRFEMTSYNEPLFGHTWAEIFIAEYGWVPVEFHGIVIGALAMTAENVTDPELRNHITAQGDRYLDYYFGNLDCHRVVCSNSVKAIPQVLVQKANSTSIPQAAPPRVIKYECSLTFECTSEIRKA
jgi:UDP:flavonoid glycosyltransferase YjiC (YdhE family)/transglutaminase-like putative cysteine protease